MTVPTIDAPIRHWGCPACPVTDVTQKPEVHTQMHNCPGTGGLMIPLVEVAEHGATPAARHVPQLSAEGSLVSIGTEHADGRVDRTIFVGVARPDRKDG